METIVVGAQFNGPPDSGNGGYTCGLVAGALGAGEVTLRLPPPLDTRLRIDGTGVYDGEHLVAETGVGTADVTPPPFPGYDAAVAAQQRYAGLRDHPFPTCFVCGPRRTDGLGLHSGPVGEAHVAATWTPATDLADGGIVRPEFVWAALDCPGAWALMQTDESPMVLGQLAVAIHGPVRPGMPYVVTGWRHAPREGRKNYAGTAVHDAAGTLIATGRSTWITLHSSSGGS